MRPRLNARSIACTSASASFKIVAFSSGTTMSATETVKAPLVEYRKPSDLMLSSICAVTVTPCAR